MFPPFVPQPMMEPESLIPVALAITHPLFAGKCAFRSVMVNVPPAVDLHITA